MKPNQENNNKVAVWAFGLFIFTLVIIVLTQSPYFKF